MQVDTYFWIFVVWKYDMIFSLRYLAVCIKTKKFFFQCFLWTLGILILDLYLYGIKISTNIKQNSVEKYAGKSHIFFWNNFWRKFLFFSFGLGPTWPIWLGWTQPAQAGHWSKLVTQLGQTCIKFYACMNSAKVIKLPSHSSYSFLQIARM
jgi:hypothetical protein